MKYNTLVVFYLLMLYPLLTINSDYFKEENDGTKFDGTN